MRRPTVRHALTGIAATGAATAVTASLTWFSAPVEQITGTATVAVSGRDASPALGGLLLVIAAGVVAFLLARGALARVVSIAVALACAGVVATAVGATGSPETVLRDAATSTTGVPELAGAITTTPWGSVTIVLAVLLLLAGLALAVAPARVSRASARYERSSAAAADPAASPVDTWDALSRGEDPTEH